MGPRDCPPGVAAFWIDADHSADPRHPLERELSSRQDAVARYARQCLEAEETGYSMQAEKLGLLLQRQIADVGRIEVALHNQRRPWPYRPVARQPAVLFRPRQRATPVPRPGEPRVAGRRVEPYSHAN